MRLPLLRRIVGAVLALGALGSSAAVFWIAYTGEVVTWRSFEPNLLGATLVVVIQVALLVAAARAESLAGGANAPVVAALAVSASAVTALAYAGSIAVAALVLPLPSLAVAGASLAGNGVRRAPGLIGLGIADAIALVGLSLVYARTGSVSLGPAGGLGPPLLLAAALLKAGAVPAVATWRLAAARSAASWLDIALRGQAIALAVLAGLTMRSSAPAAALAVAAAICVAAGGWVSAVTRDRGAMLAGVTGVGSSLAFLALGLGGAVGTRAFLLLFPPVLLSAALVPYLLRENPDEAEPPQVRAPWRALAACAGGVAVGSLLGFPPGGGFPGTWLAVSLAVSRSELTLGWLAVSAAVGIGLVLAMTSAIQLVRAARVRATHAVVGALGALALLYVGTQPIRIGIGWWIRVETALELPQVLPTAGAPGLPAIGGLRLLLLLAPAAFVVLAVIGLGRGARLAEDVADRATAAARSPRRFAPRLRKVLSRPVTALKPLREQLSEARARGAGYVVAGILELAAVFLAGRIVMLAARAGFL